MPNLKNIPSDSQNPDSWKLFHDLERSHPQTAERKSQNNKWKIKKLMTKEIVSHGIQQQGTL